MSVEKAPPLNPQAHRRLTRVATLLDEIAESQVHGTLNLTAHEKCGPYRASWWEGLQTGIVLAVQDPALCAEIDKIISGGQTPSAKEARMRKRIHKEVKTAARP